MAATLELVRSLVQAEHGLTVVSVLRPDGTISGSVVNAGVLAHPVDGSPVVGLVARGSARKLAYLRERPYASLVLRAGWQWASVEGAAEIIGPDDPVEGVDVRLLLRAVFEAAGGTHDDFDEYDRVMAAERRAAVLVRPDRLVTNP